MSRQNFAADVKIYRLHNFFEHFFRWLMHNTDVTIVVALVICLTLVCTVFCATRPESIRSPTLRLKPKPLPVTIISRPFSSTAQRILLLMTFLIRPFISTIVDVLSLLIYFQFAMLLLGL